MPAIRARMAITPTTIPAIAPPESDCEGDGIGGDVAPLLPVVALPVALLVPVPVTGPTFTPVFVGLVVPVAVLLNDEPVVVVAAAPPIAEKLVGFTMLAILLRLAGAGDEKFTPFGALHESAPAELSPQQNQTLAL